MIKIEETNFLKEWKNLKLLAFLHQPIAEDKVFPGTWILKDWICFKIEVNTWTVVSIRPLPTSRAWTAFAKALANLSYIPRQKWSITQRW